jgi:hypothetical protein
MLSRLFPRHADNSYRGSRIALWLFGLVVLIKAAMSLNAIFNGYVVASSADGIPLDAFPSAAARTVVALFALWGVAHLTFCLLGVLVLVRYRSLVPAVLGLLLFEHSSRGLALHFLPVAKVGAGAGSYVNLGLVTVMVIGLALSLWGSEAGSAHE